MENKKSSIEWLRSLYENRPAYEECILDEEWEQAKAMHKEEMIDFALLFANSDSVYIEYDCEDCPAELTIERPDRLFNEIFGGEE